MTLVRNEKQKIYFKNASIFNHKKVFKDNLS